MIPTPSYARATILKDPPRGGVHGNVHNTQVSPDIGSFRVASVQVEPPSVLTSTREIPRSPANAIPPISVVPPTTALSGGVAIIATVWIRPLPSSEFVQPFCCQYPRNSPCTASILVTHFAWNIPYNPGTMIRAGYPWAVASGPPFI